MDSCDHKPIDETLSCASTSMPENNIGCSSQTCRYCGEKITLRNSAELPRKKTLGRFWFATSFSTAMLFLDLEIHVGVVLAVGSLIASMHFLQHIGRYLHWQQISENESENETEPMRVYHSKALEEAQRRLERDRYRG